MGIDIVTAALLASVVTVVILVVLLIVAIYQRRHFNRQQATLEALVTALSANLEGLTLARAAKVDKTLADLRTRNYDLYLTLDALSSGLEEREQLIAQLGQFQQASLHLGRGLDFSSFSLSVLLTALSSFTGFAATFLFGNTSGTPDSGSSETSSQIEQLLASLHRFIPVGHTSAGILIMVGLGLAIFLILLALLTLAVYSVGALFVSKRDVESVQRVQHFIATSAAVAFPIAFLIVGVCLGFGALSL